MALRVLHVLDHSIPLHSGYAFRTLAILREQIRRGIEPVMLTSPKHYGATMDEETIDGLRFCRTRRPATLLRRLPVIDQAMVVFDTAQRIAEVARHERVDLIHAHSPALNGLAALRAARALGLPVVYEMRASWEDAAVDHGTTRAGSARYRVSRHLETRVFRHAAAVTTICNGLRDDIVARGIDAQKVTVIPNAVNVEEFPLLGAPDQSLRVSLGLGPGPVLGFLGSYYRYEGLDLLLAALPQIAQRVPDVQVLLVGGGPEDASLQRQAAALGIADRVRFVGRVPHGDVARHYSLVDLLVYPRRSIRLTETVTPLKPLEAMAQGRIFIASNVGGHRELVPAPLHDRLFAADRVDALADAACGLLGDRSRWPVLAREGRRYVEENRTWRASVERYDAVYASAIQGREAPYHGASGRAAQQ